MPILAAVSATRKPDPVVDTAHDLADAYGAELHVLYVMPDETFEQRQSDLSSGDKRNYFLDNAVSDAEEYAEEIIEATLADYDDGRVIPRGEVGDPTEMILAVAEDIDARYIVVGGRKRSPVGKALFGSTTQSLLLDADRPVVTVMRD